MKLAPLTPMPIFAPMLRSAEHGAEGGVEAVIVGGDGGCDVAVRSETEDVEDGEREEAVADVVDVESIVEVKGVGVWIVDP